MIRPGILALGIDPSSSCGWAFAAHRFAGSTDRRGRVLERPTCERIASGTWQLSPKGKHPGVRFTKLVAELEAAVARFGVPNLVGFERPAIFRSYDATFSVYGIVATLHAWASTRSIPVVPVPIYTIKERAGAKGKDKGPIMDYVARVFRCHPCTDDEADALVIARIVPLLADPADVF